MNETKQRKLDAWIAENVMGYRRTCQPDEHTTDAATLFWHRPAGDTREAVLAGRAYSHTGLTKEYGKEMFSHSWTFYQPTTDSAAAMEVLKKCSFELAETHFALITIVPPVKPINKFWTLGTIGGKNLKFDPEAYTLELAICLFAKKLFSNNLKKLNSLPEKFFLRLLKCTVEQSGSSSGS